MESRRGSIPAWHWSAWKACFDYVGNAGNQRRKTAAQKKESRVGDKGCWGWLAKLGVVMVVGEMKSS